MVNSPTLWKTEKFENLESLKKQNTSQGLISQSWCLMSGNIFSLKPPSFLSFSKPSKNSKFSKKLKQIDFSNTPSFSTQPIRLVKNRFNADIPARKTK